jgi:hypothetical protein
MWPEPPPGFTRRVDGKRAVYVGGTDETPFVGYKLDDPAEWERRLAAAPATRGRGATAILETSRSAWRLKRMRRGGATARIWNDRYPRAKRLVKILATGAEALRNGLPTARPVGLLMESGPGPLVRGWMAFEEIANAESVAERLLAGKLTRDDLAAALGTVRAFHDEGFIHPDLNLGNVLLRPTGSRIEAFVIDLDRTTATNQPADTSTRIDALRRLERSCEKLTGSPAPLGPGSDDLWYSLYAGSDADLARRLTRSRAAGRALLAWHRLGWRKGGR